MTVYSGRAGVGSHTEAHLGSLVTTSRERRSRGPLLVYSDTRRSGEGDIGGLHCHHLSLIEWVWDVCSIIGNFLRSPVVNWDSDHATGQE